MTAWQDVRFAARSLARTPGFTTTALLTLFVCIGTTTAIFGVVNQVVLRPLPLPESERLVTFWHAAPSKGLDEVNLNDALFSFYRDRSRRFEGIAAYEVGRFVLTGVGGHPATARRACLVQLLRRAQTTASEGLGHSWLTKNSAAAARW